MSTAKRSDLPADITAEGHLKQLRVIRILPIQVDFHRPKKKHKKLCLNDILAATIRKKKIHEILYRLSYV